MYHVLPPNIRPQLASEITPDDVLAERTSTVITRDGRYELRKFRPTSPKKPSAFQWNESATGGSASPMVIGLGQALAFARRQGWSVWAGTADEARSLIVQWKKKPA